jgi:5-methylcytosine-specific restriction endonuclease McrA
MAMVPLLRARKFLAAATTVNDGITATEQEHRVELMRYLQEIPQDFMVIAESPRKRELVAEHLRRFYRGQPKDAEIGIVLDRITNLALLQKVGREGYENKARQSAFKNTNWKTIERCAICGHKFAEVQDVSLDHIVPLAFGGAEREDNWQLTCKLCNQQKASYWGVADISRSHCLTTENGFFRLAPQQIIEQLRQPSNPTRYWVLERDEHRCTVDDCATRADQEKLYVGITAPGFLLTVDNLSTYCRDCVLNLKRPHCQ